MTNAMTKKHLKVKTVLLLMLVALTISCTNNYSDRNEFLVTEKSVGVFSKGMTVKDVLKLVPKDQIKKVVDFDDHENSYDDYQYFDVNKKHLLTLTPAHQDDINSHIKSILILDQRYQTSNNIGLSSTYAELLSNYKITDYEPDLEHITLKVADINAWFSISKNQLGASWWDDTNKRIDSSQIPENATFDTFVIWWN